MTRSSTELRKLEASRIASKPAAKVAKLKRGRLFYRLVRTNLIAALVRECGYERVDARELVDALTDAQIDAQADANRIEAIGDGGFLAWLIDHLDEIRSLVELLLGLFSLFANQAVANARAAATPEADGV